MSEPLRPARRKVPEPPQAAEGWRGADVTDAERVDDEFIVRQIADPETPVKAYPPLQPEDEHFFRPRGSTGLTDDYYPPDVR